MIPNEATPHANQAHLLRAGRSGQGDPSCPLDGAGVSTTTPPLPAEPVVASVRPWEHRIQRFDPITRYGYGYAGLSAFLAEASEIEVPRLLSHYAGWQG
jgi:hypothetical protein